MPDDYSANHAMADRIVAFWRERGLAVDLEITSVGTGKFGGFFQIRSDMVDGLPVPERRAK
jgi:hypothetical protein